MKEPELIEFELQGNVAAQVALVMYGRYKQEMEPSVFIVISFEDWLKKIIK